MGGDEASWISESVLRQPLEDWFAKEVLFRLAKPPSIDPELRRVLLLRLLSSDLAARRFSESTLMCLNSLEELERPLGATATYRAQTLACGAVADELTASSLRAAGLGVYEFRTMAEGIWNNWVSDLERSKASGLQGGDLRERKKLVEEAIGDDEWTGRVLREETAQEAAKALGNYLRLVFQQTGPPLLERMARRCAAGDLNQFQSLSAETRVGGKNGEQNGSVEVATKSRPQPHKPAAPSAFANRDDAKQVHLAAADDAGERVAHGRGKAPGYQLLPSKEVEAGKEALKSSCVDLERVVRDPLPEALQKARDVQATAMGKSENLAIPNAGCPYVDSHARETLANIMAEENNRGDRQNAEAPRPRLPERNPTAGTVESDDSEEEISGKTSCSLRRLQLASPRLGRVPLLKRHNDGKFVRRRKIKKWPAEEEESLRTAVEKYGTGVWKFILQRHPELFTDRTEVDLKDKWRNMTRKKYAS
ncbi:uncharacterized protein LOC144711910 isoform X2 [Wolffia australiana]